MRVLVTGASGFVGAHLSVDLARVGYEVIALGSSRLPGLQVQSAVFKTARCDLSHADEVEELLEAERPEAIVHAAALSRSAGCEQDPDRAFQVNVGAVQNLVRALQSVPSQPRIIALSTDLVYDGLEAPEQGFTEKDHPKAISVYGRTKLGGEEFLKENYPQATTLRLSLVAGKEIDGQQGFLSWFMKAFREEQPLVLFEDEFRTPVWVADVLKIVETLLKLSGNTPPLLHVAGSRRYSRVEMGSALANALGYSTGLIEKRLRNEVPSVPPRPKDVSLSAALLEQILGLKPRSFEEGITDLLR